MHAKGIVVKAGRIVFAGCPADEETLKEAREYAKKHGLTNEKAQLYRSDGVICIRLKVDVVYNSGERNKSNE